MTPYFNMYVFLLGFLPLVSAENSKTTLEARYGIRWSLRKIKNMANYLKFSSNSQLGPPGYSRSTWYQVDSLNSLKNNVLLHSEHGMNRNKGMEIADDSLYYRLLLFFFDFNWQMTRSSTKSS